jgi:predicted RNA-binding protein (virulence factor B family)
MLGQVAFLEFTASTAVGAFCSWGLPKELLVPFAEQTTEPKVGERHPVGLYVDSSGRLAGTLRVSEMLGVGKSGLRAGDWIDGEVWRNDPEIGLFVILEKSFIGLLPRDEPHSIGRGQAARVRVARVHRDGKDELSLRGRAHAELDADAEHVLRLLRHDATLRVGDRSEPERIRRVFGLTKKAFKRAIGRLLKQRAVEVDTSGDVRIRPETPTDAGEVAPRRPSH